jgi:hypothetical protein
MRYLILAMAMVLGCATEAPTPTVQLGGWGSDIVAPDIQGTDAVQGTDVQGTDIAQPDVQGTDIGGTDVQGDTEVQVDTPDAQIEVQGDVQGDVQVDIQPDVQPDIEIDTQADVQTDVQPDIQPDVQDVQDTQVDTQLDVQDVQGTDVQGTDVQVNAGKDTQDTKPQYECKTHADCVDKFSCTLDTCVWGFCEHAGPKVSCDDGNLCTTDICDPKGTCQNPIAYLAYCDDGNACTLGDQCDKAGNCWAGVDPKCEDFSECTDNVCDTSTGECTFKALPTKTKCKGTGCSPGECTSGGTCSNTDPFPKPIPMQCDDGNPCTNDSCNWLEKEGCVHQKIPFCKP